MDKARSENRYDARIANRDEEMEMNISKLK